MTDTIMRVKFTMSMRGGIMFIILCTTVYAGGLLGYTLAGAIGIAVGTIGAVTVFITPILDRVYIQVFDLLNR